MIFNRNSGRKAFEHEIIDEIKVGKLNIHVIFWNVLICNIIYTVNCGLCYFKIYNN